MANPHKVGFVIGALIGGWHVVLHAERSVLFLPSYQADF
jgi:hypothetical protein